MKYVVLFHCADPDEDLDACVDSKEFSNEKEALEKFNASVSDNEITHIELDGPGIYKIRKNPDYAPEIDTEGAMQAGMAFGCQGYNDYMGWG